VIADSFLFFSSSVSRWIAGRYDGAGQADRALGEHAACTQVYSEQLLRFESLPARPKKKIRLVFSPDPHLFPPGYVMRKGARWYSMPMAGAVTHTGANIIKAAYEFLDQVGIPLELDTDGVWCCLPATFPQNFELKSSTGKKFALNFPCTILNNNTHMMFNNPQYQTLIGVEDGEPQYKTTNECTIFFEVDGPYRAMVLPASRERGKKLKKRYAVFNDNGTLAELKGFEIKRRGELELIKQFQSQLFKKFLGGTTLEEAYESVGEIGNDWLDMLESRGEKLEEEDVLTYLSESTNMSKKVVEYGGQKSRAITGLIRLSEFLDDPVLAEGGKVSIAYVISAKPTGDPVTTRVIPIQVFQSEDVELRLQFLRKWTKNPSLMSGDVRDVLDWGYYQERLGFQVHKLISIPAALQGVPNPVPRVKNPDWLTRDLDLTSLGKQRRMTDMFALQERGSAADIEELALPAVHPPLDFDAEVLEDAPEDDIEADEEEAAAEAPESDSDAFSAWLAAEKYKWRRLREERKRRRYGKNTY
jgi:DNA polymerase epsilon subunit 1